MDDYSEHDHQEIQPNGNASENFPSVKEENFDDILNDEPESVLGIELDTQDDCGEEPVLSAGANENDSVSGKLDGLQRQLDRLSYDFQKKILHDEHKDKIINDLHEELQQYKKDILKKQFQSTLLDIIHIMDDIRKLTQHYREKDSSDYDPMKLLELIETIPSDMDDLFSSYGIESFTSIDTPFDPKRQKVLKKLETDDITKDKIVVKSLRPGYEWEGNVIRTEMVEVHIYNKNMV